MGQVAELGVGANAESAQSFAIQAQRRGDFASAAEGWERVRRLRPDDAAGYLEGAKALKALNRSGEAVAVATQGVDRFPAHADLLSLRAGLHFAQNDLPAAEADWRVLCGMSPPHAGAVVALSRMLTHAKRYDDAEKLLSFACLASPDCVDFHQLHAEIPVGQRKWELAEQRYWALIDRFGATAQNLRGLVTALLEQRRFNAAELVALGSLTSFPSELMLAEAYARCAEGRGDWQEAERRWTKVGEDFPHSALAAHGVALACSKRQDGRRAEEKAAEAAARFPNHTGILCLHAALATWRKDWDEAGRRWRRVQEVAPRYKWAYMHQADALNELGRAAEAAAVLDQAIGILPDEIDLATKRARMAVAFTDWLPAARAYYHHMAADPEDRGLRGRAFEAAWRAVGSRDAQKAQAALALAAFPHKDHARTLMSRFESIGNNFEFASVQRFYGTEPISLFRWAEAKTDKLASALEANLDGLGDAGQTVFEMPADYVLSDRRYGLATHTFVHELPSDVEQFRQKQCQRLRYLRRKFLEDLEAGEKIFVYKTSESDPMPLVERLFAAIRSRGPGRLLYVTRSEPGHPAGSVDEVKPGLMIGYLNSVFDEQTNPQIEKGSWDDILRNAAGLVDNLGKNARASYNMRELAPRFESMGNNCEFGHFQRFLGAETLGLLRWTATTLETLSELIELGFPGVGDPENVEMTRRGDEYFARDTRYDMVLRTFMRPGADDHAVAMKEHERRTSLLRQKFLANLRRSDAIFVHKTAVPENMKSVFNLHAAMQRQGPATLLHVRPPAKDQPDQYVNKIAPGLLVGYLNRLVDRGGMWDPPYEGWLELCRKAAEMA